MAAFLRLAALWWIAFAASSAQALVFAGPKTQVQPPADVEISHGTAYVCTPSGLQILDATDLAAGYAPLGAFPMACSDVEVRGSYAYLAGNELRVLDVSDPTVPVELGALSIDRPAFDLDVVGGHAYVVVGPLTTELGALELRIFDVANPAAPIARGALQIGLPIFGSYADGAIAVENGVAFVQSLEGGVSIDVTNPAAPVLLGSLGFGSDLFGRATLVVRNGVLYASASPDEPEDEDDFPFPTVRVVDVSDPSAPAELSRFESTCRALEVAGGVLYCADFSELRLVDVSVPTEPVDLGVLYIASGPLTDVAVEKGFAHVGIGAIQFFEPSFLQAVDVRVPGFPSRTPFPFVGTPEYTALEVVGNYLYAGTFHGLEIFDVRGGVDPPLVATSGLSGIVRDVAVSGSTVYVAADNNVTIFRSEPELLLFGTLPSHGRSLAVAGNRLYVGTSNGSLDIYDLADPTQPALLSSLPLTTSSGIEDIDLAGNVLYAPTIFSGIRVVDVSNPASPFAIGTFDLPRALTTAVYGSLLYAGGLGSGGVVLDASDPTQLRQIGSFGQPYSPRELEVRDDRLYMSASVLQVFDLSSPTAPVSLGAVWPSTTFAVSSSGIAYTSASGGFSAPMFAIDFGPEYAPPLEVDINVKPGDRHNRVLLGRPHALVVALLGSATLDVRDVDQRALALGPDGAPALISVPAVVNRDRRKDLLSVFWTPDTGIAFGDTEVCLEGRLRDGRRLRGCDEILTHTGCGRGYEAALVVPLCVPLARAARRLQRARSH